MENKINKKDIKIILRNNDFYPSDLEMIEREEEGWENMKILHDLVSDISENFESESIFVGVIICNNKETNKIEVLQYK